MTALSSAEVGLLLSLLAGCSVESADCGSRLTQSGEVVDGRMCAQALRGELTISSEFTAEQQTAIMSATDSWAEETAGRVAITWRVVDTGAYVNPRPASQKSGAWGSYNPGLAKIWFRQDLDLALLHSAALHEFGHMFGLGHAEPGELMAPNSKRLPITPADLAHFDAVAAASGL